MACAWLKPRLVRSVSRNGRPAAVSAAHVWWKCCSGLRPSSATRVVSQSSVTATLPELELFTWKNSSSWPSLRRTARSSNCPAPASSMLIEVMPGSVSARQAYSQPTAYW